MTLHRFGPSGGTALSIAVSPADPAVVFFGMEDGQGIWRSVDGGATAEYVSGDVPNVSGFTLAIDPGRPERIWAGCFYGHGVYRSLNGGRSWALHNEGLPGRTPRWARAVSALVFDPTVNGRLFAYTLDGLYVLDSRSSAPRWQSRGRAPALPQILEHERRNHAVRIHLVAGKSGTLYLGGGNSPVLYTTTVNGGDWTPRHEVRAAVISDLAVDPESEMLYVASTGQNRLLVHTSRDQGRTWTGIHRVAGGLTASLALSGRRLWLASWRADVSIGAVAAQRLLKRPGNVVRRPNVRVEHTDDGGATWSTAEASIATGFVNGIDAHPADPDTAWVRMLRVTHATSDAGASFTPAVQGAPTTGYMHIAVAHSRIHVVHPGIPGVPATSDIAAHEDMQWRSLEPTSWNPSVMASNPVDARVLLAGSWVHGIQRSDHSGRKWVGTNANDGLVNAIVWSSNGLQAFAAIPNRGVYKSNNAGRRWVRVAPMAQCNDVLIGGTTRVWAAGATDQDAGAFQSDDFGISWRPIGPGNVVGVSLAADENGVLYLGTGDGLFRSADGRKWRRLDPGWGGVITSVLTPEVNVVYAAVNALDRVQLYTPEPTPGWFVSLDAGKSWRNLTQDQRPCQSVSSAVEAADGTIYVLSNGIARLT